MTEQIHCEAVVIGAGAVGLACAAALAHSGRDVVILEAESRFGSQTSSRNTPESTIRPAG
jgi:phytoene dehydrogenase-like protein